MNNNKQRKIAINNEIVLMRQAVKKARVGIIWKLKKESQRILSRSHVDEKVNEKWKRKGNNLIKELKVLKTIKDDDITKYAITNNKSLSEVLNDSKSKLKTKILTKMAFHKILKTRIEDFKKKFPDYLEYMGPGRREKSKIEFLEKKKGVKNNDENGDDKNIKNKKPDNENNNPSVDGDDTDDDNDDDDDTSIDADDAGNDDDDNKKKNEKEEVNQSEKEESDSEEDINNEDDNKDNEDDDEDDEDEDDDDDDDDEADENKDNDDSVDKYCDNDKEKNKVSTENKKTLIPDKVDKKESKELNKSNLKNIKIQEKNKSKKSASTKSPDKCIKRQSENLISQEVVVKRLKLDDDNDLDEIFIDNVNTTDTTVKKEEKINVTKTKDSFFMTEGDDSSDENNQTSDEDNNINDNNFNKQRKFNSDYPNRKARRVAQNDNKFKSIMDNNSDYPNRKARRVAQNNNKFKPIMNNKIKHNNYENNKINKPKIDENLHPSWAAKKKQQIIINQGVQAKKIVFDY